MQKKPIRKYEQDLDVRYRCVLCNRSNLGTRARHKCINDIYQNSHSYQRLSYSDILKLSVKDSTSSNKFLKYI